jgi:hypothetical protein
MQKEINGYKFYVRYNVNTDGVDIFLMQRRHDGNYIGSINEIGGISMAKTCPNAITKPMFTLPDFLVSLLLDSLIEAGTKPEPVSKIEGLYEAQTKHLEDLRKILKTQKIMR